MPKVTSPAPWPCGVASSSSEPRSTPARRAARTVPRIESASARRRSFQASKPVTALHLLASGEALVDVVPVVDPRLAAGPAPEDEPARADAVEVDQAGLEPLDLAPERGDALGRTLELLLQVGHLLHVVLELGVIGVVRPVDGVAPDHLERVDAQLDRAHAAAQDVELGEDALELGH